VKDQATVIRAIACVEGIRLRLAGDGTLRKELEALARQLGVQSRVEFLGVRHDIPELIANADLYIQPSIREGYCLAAVEAMCGGLPCIAAGNSGLQEVVGLAGLFYEPGNAQELASAIRLLAADPVRRAEMARLSVQQAARFTLQACSAGYANFYQEIIQ
jgi:glycosyltransferase involved in cell wall biosynthesis